jgi:signal transduction histidine kinase
VFEAAWHEVERLQALEELEALNADLERRVQERTEELQAANEELQAQSEELAASNEELAAANEELLAQAEELNAANLELESQAEQLAEQARELEQRAQELAAANEAKTRFLRTMSHELRTPLNSIIGFTELLLQGLAGPLNDEQRKQLSMVNASGHHLLALVNDLLDLSRIEAGAVVLAHERIDVADVVREVLETIRPAAEAKGLALTCEIPDPAPPLVSDKTRGRQILLNLLNNAVKFTDHGSVSLAVSRDGYKTVTFAVKDTGPGISKERLGDIFKDFVRLQDGGPREGAGLGLAIARQLAGALGGSLTVASRVGTGSTFSLTLPQE